jgi:hypothetical protein
MLWYRDTHSNQSIFGELLGFMGKVYGYRSKRLFSHVGMTYTGSTQVAELSRICFGTCGCDTNMCTCHTLDRLWLMCKNNQKYTYSNQSWHLCRASWLVHGFVLFKTCCQPCPLRPARLWRFWLRRILRE